MVFCHIVANNYCSVVLIFRRFGNGVFKQVIVVMSISAATNLLLANTLTPVFRDEITGMSVYPLRWIEWTVLVSPFLVSFLLSLNNN